VFLRKEIRVRFAFEKMYNLTTRQVWSLLQDKDSDLQEIGQQNSESARSGNSAKPMPQKQEDTRARKEHWKLKANGAEGSRRRGPRCYVMERATITPRVHNIVVNMKPTLGVKMDQSISSASLTGMPVL
jgi:hypothetical protein